VDLDGKLAKKARLVARGCKQNKNESSYAHVPESTAIRVFLAIIANRQLRMEQLDIKAAYLNSHLNEEVYMTIPKGFPDEEKLYSLKKAMYKLNKHESWNLKRS